jgi:hypothetical protein
MTNIPEFLEKYLAQTPVLVRHDSHCTRKGFPHSDAAKKVSDTLNLHWAAALAGEYDSVIRKWVVFSLSDGAGGMQMYDSKRDAVRHHKALDEKLFMYLCLAPGGMGVCEAELQLRTYRQLYDNGARFADPDHARGGMDFINRIAAEHRVETLRRLREG